ncbi:chromatin-binding exonuclease XRN1 SCDLUD_001404 [Saccharomycodes ludwigii]|uniref:chromatin-binding exonuclease XRN1 n=1 Tax=Saccharomycodes ludwigii TaxID=36035 RepID=UPI001E8C5755|nr:hypothetical protein SCDLUD_001404 [Saccharomycodes ludwigii]KAH3901638.1 hypothetical protein SCDLUD_001404 [Saccharomycodes ludwigii]
MGIPKFFRYISQRWPEIQQLIEGDEIPEFDNLYLDMNSILHNCTRSNDLNAKLTDEAVYAKIFSYIDHLFQIIKPKQTFYMAIDGVAPRAKMNQQRARRFRAAEEVEEAIELARSKGESVPNQDDLFDKNAITPGTDFMTQVTKNLKYFIHDKISNDSSWSQVNVIFSGQEVPGEGEHKIMDYIRSLRASHDYNPNTRHCIYGLDADLIILGLSSHDHHFALLREEVLFTKKAKSNAELPLERQNFYLLHLSLLREYLELEFNEITDDLKLEYNFERILDDMIFALFVIGNDFLPNLPDLHLNKGAFSYILQTFKEALKQMDDYMTLNGTINMESFSIWLRYLSDFELMNFEKDDIDLEWFNSQIEKISLNAEKKRAQNGKVVLLKQQKKMVGVIKKWALREFQQRKNYMQLIKSEDDIPAIDLTENKILPSSNEKDEINAEENLAFVKKLGFELGLILTHSRSTGHYSLKIDVDGINPHETEEEYLERLKSLKQTFKNYEQGVLFENKEVLTEVKGRYNEKFEDWKDNYYKDKIGFSSKEEPEKLIEMCENYVEGLQWVLYYYYRGCPAWGWYYKYHYAPRISDVKLGVDAKIHFDLGKPLLPFQQLMAVLPKRSKKLIPAAYRPLMIDEHSVIADFYPDHVAIDQNGKAAAWEAVVLINFVDEHRLLEAMKPYDPNLTPEEKARNILSTDFIYLYNPQVDDVYKTPLSGMFTDIEHNHCVEQPFVLEKISHKDLRYGLHEDADTGIKSSGGFPSLKFVPFTSSLEYNETQVFERASKDQSVCLHIEDSFKAGNLGIDEISASFLDSVVYTRWPFVRESKVVSISNGKDIYRKVAGKIRAVDLDHNEIKDFNNLKNRLKRYYSHNKAVILDDIRIIVNVVPVKGLLRDESGSYIKHFGEREESYPLQLVIPDVLHKDSRFVERNPLPIDQEFPIGSKVLFLGDYAYGSEAIVEGFNKNTRLKLKVYKRSFAEEPTIGHDCAELDKKNIHYLPSFVVAKELNVSPLFLSKIASEFRVMYKGRPRDFGLSLKFESRQQKVLGYAKRYPRGWGYSNLAVNLILTYKKMFPEIFNKLTKVDNSIPTLEDLFFDLGDGKLDALVKNVVQWLNDTKKVFVTVSLESDALSKVAIGAVEDFVIQHVANQNVNIEVKLLAKVPRSAVLIPKESYALLHRQKFNLGDRVIYVQASGKVPLFSKGTVIGYFSLGRSLMIQVIFDQEIVAGSTLGGRLKTSRGLGLDSSCLINISTPQFIYHSRASKTHKEQKADPVMNKETLKKRIAVAKKKQATELLSIIKKDNSEVEKEQDSAKVVNGHRDLTAKQFNSNSGPQKSVWKAKNNTNSTGTPDDNTVPVKKSAANKVYDSIFNQFDNKQNAQFLPYGQNEDGIPHGLPIYQPNFVSPIVPPGSLPFQQAVPPPVLILAPNGVPIPAPIVGPDPLSQQVSSVPVTPFKKQASIPYNGHVDEKGSLELKKLLLSQDTSNVNQEDKFDNHHDNSFRGNYRGGHRGSHRGSHRGGNHKNNIRGGVKGGTSRGNSHRGTNGFRGSRENHTNKYGEKKQQNGQSAIEN